MAAKFDNYFDVIPALPFPSSGNAKGFVGWFKSLLFEKAICIGIIAEL